VATACGRDAVPAAACGPLREQTDQVPAAASAIVQRVKVPARIRVGDSVSFVLTVRNTGDSAVVIHPAAPGSIEFLLKRARDSTWTWRSNPGGMEASLGLSDTMAPGVMRVFRETWRPRDDSGRAVPPGIYCVYGWLLHDPPVAMPAPPTTLTIEP